MEDYESLLDECNVAENLRSGLLLYLTRGIEPGSFLTACLENDLKTALGVASTQTWDYIFNVVQFLYHHAPFPSWGSVDAVQKWIESFQREE